MIEGIFTAIITLIIVIAVLYLTYVITKQIGNTSLASQNSGSMKTIDRIALGREKMIAVVKIGEKYYVVGITANNINLIDELTEEEGRSIASRAKNIDPAVYQQSFRNILDKVKNRKAD